jgi:hypothetical protein
MLPSSTTEDTMAKPTDTRQPNTEQPPKIDKTDKTDKTELPPEKLDEVSGGFVWGTTRIVPVTPPVKP